MKSVTVHLHVARVNNNKDTHCIVHVLWVKAYVLVPYLQIAPQEE